MWFWYSEYHGRTSQTQLAARRERRTASSVKREPHLRLAVPTSHQVHSHPRTTAEDTAAQSSPGRRIPHQALHDGRSARERFHDAASHVCARPHPGPWRRRPPRSRPSVGGGAGGRAASRVHDGGDRTDGVPAAHIFGADEAPTSKSTRFAIGCADAGGGERCTGSCSSKVLRSTDVGGGCTTEWRWRWPTFAERPWEGMRERNRHFASQLTELACERIAGPLAVST
jgi:hypothetical protein